MTQAPGNTAPMPEPGAPTPQSPLQADDGATQKPPKVKPASMLKLMLSRPLLPVKQARLLGWLAFVVLAIMPLAVTAGTVWYLRSSRWPADFSRELSARVGLPVHIERLSYRGPNMRAIRGLTIGEGSEPLLRATSVTSDAGEGLTLTVEGARVRLDLDWWSDQRAVPGAEAFAHPVGQEPPMFHLRDVKLTVSGGGQSTEFSAEAGLLHQEGGLVRGELVGRQAGLRSVTGTLGYSGGRFVKELRFRGVAGPLVERFLVQALGRNVSAGFVSPAGDLMVGILPGGGNWMLVGESTYDPARLSPSLGLEGLTGTFKVKFENVGGYNAELNSGQFTIELADGENSPGTCSADALRALQFLATGAEPKLSDEKPFTFDHVGMVITLSKEKVYIRALGEGTAVISNKGAPILKIRPQSLRYDDLLARFKELRGRVTDLRLTARPDGDPARH